MTITREQLLAAVLAEPDEDAPRLAYADWLDEHGEPERAEFIRVQVELATMTCSRNWHPEPCRPLGPGGAGGPFSLCESLRRRERKLLYRLCVRLDSELPESLASCIPDWWLGKDVPSATFRRGFVHAVACTAEDFLAHAGAIFAAQPVREVTLTTWPEPVYDASTWTTAVLLVGDNRRATVPVPITGVGSDKRDDARRLLKAEWPGIKFTLPDGV